MSWLIRNFHHRWFLISAVVLLSSNSWTARADEPKEAKEVESHEQLFAMLEACADFECANELVSLHLDSYKAKESFLKEVTIERAVSLPAETLIALFRANVRQSTVIKLNNDLIAERIKLADEEKAALYLALQSSQAVNVSKMFSKRSGFRQSGISYLLLRIFRPFAPKTLPKPRTGPGHVAILTAEVAGLLAFSMYYYDSAKFSPDFFYHTPVVAIASVVLIGQLAFDRFRALALASEAKISYEKYQSLRRELKRIEFKELEQLRDLVQSREGCETAFQVTPEIEDQN